MPLSNRAMVAKTGWLCRGTWFSSSEGIGRTAKLVTAGFGALAARLAAKAIELGVGEMQVRLSERQGQMIPRVFAAALDDTSLGLTPEQRNTGRKLVASHLRTPPRRCSPR